MGPLSYPFEVEGQEKILWDPALRVGQLYVSITRSIGDTLGLTTGLTPNSRGGAYVDLASFQAFTQRAYETYISTTNLQMRDMIRSVLTTSIVMLTRGGGTLVRTPDREATLMEQYDTYMRHMWVED
ncbi:DUF6086 family protein [Streptomyces acidiscabies]|uniref:DUF6086 family protein n=1 Tax=Streptomyces acidiscabies TaxID=42234 RepID=UPI0038F6BB85